MNGLDLGAFLDASTPARDVTPGEPFDPWRLKVLSAEELAALAPTRAAPSASQLAYLTWYDVLAPTSHNTLPQRFRFHPEDGLLEVWLDRTCVLAASDVAGRQAAVSVGCGIANIQMAARAYGWGTRIELMPVLTRDTHPASPGEPRYTRLARVLFDPWSVEPEGVGALRAMLARKVIRAEYDERVKLTAAQIEALHAVVHRYEGLELHLLTDSATLLFLGKFQELADSTVFNREAFATELGDWLLANDSRSLVGMRGQEYGLGDDAARRVHLGLRRQLTLLPDEMAGFAKAGNLGMRSSSAVAVITVEDDSVPHRVRVGQAYEETALLLQQQHFCTAMHAGITEVEAPNLALRGRLRTRKRPTAVFRIGRPLREADGHRPHASRPGLAAMLLPPDAV